jgi:hypothetical protein
MSNQVASQNVGRLYTLVNRPNFDNAIDSILKLDSTIGISVNGWLLENPIPFLEGFDSAEYFSALTDFEWFRQLKVNDNIKCFLLFEGIRHAVFFFVEFNIADFEIT